MELARRGEGHTRPNPPVGAVIVKGGKIIGEGWHKRCGGDHAEVAAIKDALKKCGEAASSPLRKRRASCFKSGGDAASPLRDSTLYVTLEPCSKPGRVGACTDAIIATGLKRVVYAVPDPNPKNRGKAKRALAKAGVVCERASDRTVRVLADRLIAPFAKHVTTGLPYVTVKIAMSLDGKICDDYGNARWISSAESRKVTGGMRGWVDAIMVGAETVRKDNPSLLSHGKRNDDLIRVVVTRSGKIPKSAQIFTDGAPNETLVFKVGEAASRRFNKDGSLSVKSGGTPLPQCGTLKDVLRQLGKMGVMHVLCEGGLKLARALADAGLVDEWITVMAPAFIGSRRLRNAIRGTTFREQSFLSGCDSFLTAGLSEHAVWAGKVG